MTQADSKSKKQTLLTLLFLFCLRLEPNSCTEFDKEYIGVVYGSYAKFTDNGEFPEYKWTDIKTMLEVVSTKFSKIATYGVGSNPNKTYERYISYYDSNKQSYTAEAAASINKERNTTALTVLIGIRESGTMSHTDIEARVALESAAKANEIYPGTVLGLILTDTEILTSAKRASLTLEGLKIYKKEAKSYGLKIGTRQTFNYAYLNGTSDELANIQNKIVLEADFVICEYLPEIYETNFSDPEHTFANFKDNLLHLRDAMHKINPKIEVMGQTGWPSNGVHPWDNVVNLQKYWKIVNQFAIEHKFQMWMYEAFDNPFKDWHPSAPHYGWWKLTANSKSNMPEGYVEKIFDSGETLDENEAFPDFPTNKASTKHIWMYTGAANGVAMVLFLSVIITMYILRVRKLKKSLTKADFEEFISGLPNHYTPTENEHHGKDTALKTPYDTSYEISKDKLAIQTLIGSGQFGFVFKATILNDQDEGTSVALKMPKEDCPLSVLKGFLSEIKILIYLGKHENIVSIRGAYTAETLNGIVYIATELCCGGSLQDYLRKYRAKNLCSNDGYTTHSMIADNYVEMNCLSGNPNSNVDLLDMIRWSYQIANGMEYLGTKHVVHADLATRNVLLTSDKTAKITDFGLSRRLYEYTTYIKTKSEPLPWRWMSIEALKRLEFSSKSDVWSYGVTLWEIFSMGDIPYPGLSWSPDFADSLENGMRMKCPPHANADIFKIMASCWCMEADTRPTFTDLKLSFSSILDTYDSTYFVV